MSINKTMRLHELLSQKSNYLYHFTSMHTLISILKDNTLYTKYSQKPMLSFTRDPLHLFRINACVIIFDRNKLSHNYKITKVYGDSPEFMNNPQRESEERIKSPITNVRNYIVEIYLNESSEVFKTNAMEINSLCNEYDIPVYASDFSKGGWQHETKSLDDILGAEYDFR